MSEKSGYVPQAANAPPVFQNPPGYGAFVGVPSAPPSYEEACGGYTNYPNNATAQQKVWMPPQGVGPLPNMPPQGVGPLPNVQHFPVVRGEFDAGARFSSYAPPTIPPPPPGCPPNAAQMAVSKGQSVVMEKKKGGFLKGSGSGGYTFW